MTECSDRPVWVRTWRSVDLGRLSAFFGLAAVAVAMLPVATVLAYRTNMDVLVALLWLGFFVFASMGLTVPQSGIGSARLSRLVRPVDVAGVGTGLSVPERGGFAVRAGILTLALLLAMSHYVFRDDAPGPRQEQALFLTSIGAPACLAWLVLGFVIVNRTRVSLHPEGIVQQVYKRRGWAVTNALTVVPWDDVGDLRLEEHPNPAVPNRGNMPVIRVPRRSGDSEVVIMVCEKKIEPNALLALLLWCRDNSWARERLGDDDARELLRPPGLFDRIRADRAASAVTDETEVL